MARRLQLQQKDRIQAKNRYHVLHLCSDTYPLQYAFMTKVFNQIVSESGYCPTWILPSHQVTSIEKIQWEQNTAWLIPKRKTHSPYQLLMSYRNMYRDVKQAMKYALSEMPACDMVQVRDEPIMAQLANRLARQRQIPFVYQLSHLKEEQALIYARQGVGGSRVMNYMRGYIGKYLRNRLLHAADIVFPISQQMTRTLTIQGIDPHKMVSLEEGVDTQKSTLVIPEENVKPVLMQSIPADRMMFSYVGTLNKFRRLDIMIEGFAQAVQQGLNGHLLIVGADPGTSTLEDLQALTAKFNLNDRTTFTGFIPQCEVRQYLVHAHVGLSPIPNNEVYFNSSPIKILEYMAARLPVIASDLPCQDEIITKAHCGISIPMTPTAFAQAMLELAEMSPWQHRQLGENGLKWCREHRDFQVLAQLVMDAYQRFLPLSSITPSLSLAS